MIDLGQGQGGPNELGAFNLHPKTGGILRRVGPCARWRPVMSKPNPVWKGTHNMGDPYARSKPMQQTP